MFTTRTPLRITLGGGGTDLPSFYENNGEGFLVSAAINKYVYVSVHENFADRWLLKYSQFEDVQEISEITHPFIKEALHEIRPSKYLEITSMADIPAGTGLGSSGSFGVGLLHALHAHERRHVSKTDLAAAACRIEIDVLKEPVGKQDQYAAAIGGLISQTYMPSGDVKLESVPMKEDSRRELTERLSLFFTGFRRSAASELRALDVGILQNDKNLQQNLMHVRDLGYKAYESLTAGEIDALGHLFSEQWAAKYSRSPSKIHEQVDFWISSAIKSGAAKGGKLVGAGGGGFLLFLANDKKSLRKEMTNFGLREIDFALDDMGTTLI